MAGLGCASANMPNHTVYAVFLRWRSQTAALRWSPWSGTVWVTTGGNPPLPSRVLRHVHASRALAPTCPTSEVHSNAGTLREYEPRGVALSKSFSSRPCIPRSKDVGSFLRECHCRRLHAGNNRMYLGGRIATGWDITFGSEIWFGGARPNTETAVSCRNDQRDMWPSHSISPGQLVLAAAAPPCVNPRLRERRSWMRPTPCTFTALLEVIECNRFGGSFCRTLPSGNNSAKGDLPQRAGHS
jgi:hypothetical protein